MKGRFLIFCLGTLLYCCDYNDNTFSIKYSEAQFKDSPDKSQNSDSISILPLTPLELEGQDVYIEEGCYTCHSQKIQPYKKDTTRYGNYSLRHEFVYDHPFDWKEQNNVIDSSQNNIAFQKHSNSWYYQFLSNPKDILPNSIMPTYSFLNENNLDTTLTLKKIQTLRKLGVPYSDLDELNALKDLRSSSKEIASEISNNLKIDVNSKSKMIALISFLHRMESDSITLKKDSLKIKN